MTELFKPLQVGALTLPNRFVLAPLTRTRAGVEHLPNDLMAQYYAQRASGGLLITECTMVTEGTSAFVAEPGVYSAEQIAGWKKTTDAVHAKGGRIFMQIWHAGRAATPTSMAVSAPCPAALPRLKARSTPSTAKCLTPCPMR